jgi:hypothetical protein
MVTKIPTSTATIEIQNIASELADYRIAVKVYDDLGFSNERHVWHGTDHAEAVRVADVVAKAFGAVDGLEVRFI